LKEGRGLGTFEVMKVRRALLGGLCLLAITAPTKAAATADDCTVYVRDFDVALLAADARAATTTELMAMIRQAENVRPDCAFEMAALRNWYQAGAATPYPFPPDPRRVDSPAPGMARMPMPDLLLVAAIISVGGTFVLRRAAASTVRTAGIVLGGGTTIAMAITLFGGSHAVEIGNGDGVVLMWWQVWLLAPYTLLVAFVLLLVATSRAEKEALARVAAVRRSFTDGEATE
jgi:hypothetical protein